LICRVLTASSMTRQSIFSVLANREFFRGLCRPDPCLDDDRKLAQILHDGRARSMLVHAFGDVPDGWLGTLGKVGGSPMSTIQPYIRLRAIFADQANRQKARAMTLLDELSESTLAVIDVLDPQWVLPQVLKRLTRKGEAADFNRVMAFAMSSSSRNIRAGVVEALGRLQDEATLASVVERLIHRADVFPEHPLRETNEMHPLTSPLKFREAGCHFRNCLKTKIAEALAGRAAYAVFRAGGEPGPETECVVELRPLTKGFGWIVREVHAHRNGFVPQRLVNAATAACAEQGVPSLDEEGGREWASYARFMRHAEMLRFEG
jgi:hypothetical protein